MDNTWEIDNALIENDTLKMLIEYFTFYGVNVTVSKRDKTQHLLRLRKGPAIVSWLLDTLEMEQLRSQETLHILARDYIDKLDRMNSLIDKNIASFPLVETLDVQRIHAIDFTPFRIELGTRLEPTQFVVEANPSHKDIQTHGLSYVLKKGDLRVYQHPYFIRQYARNNQGTTHLLISAFNDARYLCIHNDASQAAMMDAFIAHIKQAEYHEAIKDTGETRDGR